MYLNGTSTYATLPLLQRTLSNGATLEVIYWYKWVGQPYCGLAGDHGGSPNIGLLFHCWENTMTLTTGWYGNEGYRMTIANANKYYL